MSTVLIAVGIVIATGHNSGVSNVAHHHLIDRRATTTGSDGILDNHVVIRRGDGVVVPIDNRNAIAEVARQHLVERGAATTGGDGILDNHVVTRPVHNSKAAARRCVV